MAGACTTGKKVLGFPKHPHRGFETLTVVNEGIIDHSDSLGSKARYGDGDAQWLTAGDGINHSEMFPLFNKDSLNKIDFFSNMDKFYLQRKKE